MHTEVQRSNGSKFRSHMMHSTCQGWKTCGAHKGLGFEQDNSNLI